MRSIAQGCERRSRIGRDVLGDEAVIPLPLPPIRAHGRDRESGEPPFDGWLVGGGDMERSNSGHRFVGALLKTALATALVATFAMGSVQLMARGGHSGGGDTCSAPSLTGPASASLNDSFTISGCGFAANEIIPLIGAEANGCCFTVNMVADASGRFTWVGQVWSTGDYSYKALEQTNRGWRTAATWSFVAG
jgi:hypothetical protein